MKVTNQLSGVSGQTAVITRGGMLVNPNFPDLQELISIRKRFFELIHQNPPLSQIYISQIQWEMGEESMKENDEYFLKDQLRRRNRRVWSRLQLGGGGGGQLSDAAPSLRDLDKNGL